MDFTISGHVNRALFITDSDSGTRAMEGDNGSSGSRIRVEGEGELMDGTSAGLKLEYGAGATAVLRCRCAMPTSTMPVGSARSPSAMATMAAKGPSTPTRAA